MATRIDLNKVPRFAELPIRPDKPKESSWGVFGDDDELGCLNFLTPEGIVDAARLVRKGSVFRLDTKINYANPPLFARRPAKHNIMSFESFGLLGFDDSLDSYNTQEGSQWDGLAHVGSPRYKAFYNGVKSSRSRMGRVVDSASTNGRTSLSAVLYYSMRSATASRTAARSIRSNRKSTASMI